jgi:hypothetical protein
MSALCRGEPHAPDESGAAVSLWLFENGVSRPKGSLFDRIGDTRLNF